MLAIIIPCLVIDILLLAIMFYYIVVIRRQCAPVEVLKQVEPPEYAVYDIPMQDSLNCINALDVLAKAGALDEELQDRCLGSRVS